MINFLKIKLKILRAFDQNLLKLELKLLLDFPMSQWNQTLIKSL